MDRPAKASSPSVSPARVPGRADAGHHDHRARPRGSRRRSTAAGWSVSPNITLMSPPRPAVAKGIRIGEFTLLGIAGLVDGPGNEVGLNGSHGPVGDEAPLGRGHPLRASPRGCGA